ncbi:auxin-responsive protein IAA33-like [Prosopis cineraria]|uniref:auxin-responsive protein IAA33-like n=1 Tax=Prosopis cineraria TaxID=364024 RepID=UPI00240F1B06|nr:auxin-responsive protein IAA33-like [Prosopis cineraria]XP_054795058.1 auxin-responsive protein IAA33-like [Prosopis cineraria]
MNRFDLHREGSCSSKSTYQQDITTLNIHHNNNLMSSSVTPSSSSSSASFSANLPANFTHSKFHGFPDLDDHDLLSTIVPAVTVVLEGRSICHRINLHHHASYHSLAKALRQMYVDPAGMAEAAADDRNLDLSNAIPGHLIAYEDMENDLLLAGDLNWKDFVRVAKRIRIIPAKQNSGGHKKRNMKC